MTVSPHTYDHIPDWGQLPDGRSWGNVRTLVGDSQGRLYIQHAPPDEIVILDLDGQFLGAWPDIFEGHAHGLFISSEPDGEYIYVSDMEKHVVVKCTLEGEPVWTLGEPGNPGDWGHPFNRPCDMAVAPEGDFYVADGYGNRHVHHFDPDRKLIRSWGGKGTGPGEFGSVHDVFVDSRGGTRRIWIADHPNNRLQVFTPDGEFIEELTGFRGPSAMVVNADGEMYVSEERGGRITILSPDNEVIAYIGREERETEPGQMMDPHSVWLDSRGDVYAPEVSEGQRIQKFVRRRS